MMVGPNPCLECGGEYGRHSDGCAVAIRRRGYDVVPQRLHDALLALFALPNWENRCGHSDVAESLKVLYVVYDSMLTEARHKREAEPMNDLRLTLVRLGNIMMDGNEATPQEVECMAVELRNLRPKCAAIEAIKDRLTQELLEAEAKLARIESAAYLDAEDLAKVRDGTKLTRHGVVEALMWWKEEYEREKQRAELAEQRLAEQAGVVETLSSALQKLRSYSVDIAAGRINYRPEDHIQVSDEALAVQLTQPPNAHGQE